MQKRGRSVSWGCTSIGMGVWGNTEDTVFRRVAEFANFGVGLAF